MTRDQINNMIATADILLTTANFAESDEYAEILLRAKSEIDKLLDQSKILTPNFNAA